MVMVVVLLMMTTTTMMTMMMTAMMIMVVVIMTMVVVVMTMMMIATTEFAHLCMMHMMPPGSGICNLCAYSYLCALLYQEEERAGLVEWFQKATSAAAVLPTSALNREGIDDLVAWAVESVPEGPTMYPKVNPPSSCCSPGVSQYSVLPC